MTHITDYGGAIDDYYPKKMERIVDITEHERAADIEAENARMSAEALDGGWQPIETAKNEPDVDVLLYGEGYGFHGSNKKETREPIATIGFWNANCNYWQILNEDDMQEFEPTHWREIPEPPK